MDILRNNLVVGNAEANCAILQHILLTKLVQLEYPTGDVGVKIGCQSGEDINTFPFGLSIVTAELAVNVDFGFINDNDSLFVKQYSIDAHSQVLISFTSEKQPPITVTEGDPIPPDVYIITDLEEHDKVGQAIIAEPPPIIITPTQTQINEFTKSKNVGEALFSLKESDRVVLRCYEHQTAVPVEWVNYREALREIIRTATGNPVLTLPVTPAKITAIYPPF